MSETDGGYFGVIVGDFYCGGPDSSPAAAAEFPDNAQGASLNLLLSFFSADLL